LFRQSSALTATTSLALRPRPPRARRYSFWELIDLTRKLLVAIALNFAVHLGSNIQILIITFIILLTLRMQAAFRPYRHALVNSLSVYLLTVFIIVLVMGGAVYREPSLLGAG
jgi:hypothetical protein